MLEVDQKDSRTATERVRSIVAPFSITPVHHRVIQIKVMGSGPSTSASAENANSTSFFTNKFTPNCKLLQQFSTSVQKEHEGIARNSYTHYKGDPASRPLCRHERCEGWKLDLCAECGKDLGPERLVEENKRAKQAMEEDQAQALLRPHVDRLHGLGIKTSALIAFGFAHGCLEWPVWQVVRDIIVPATRDNRCRYGELPEHKHLFSKATVFMSHCWGASFGDLIGAACHGASKDRVVWIDIFAVRQWPGNIADLDFRGVISRCGAMIVSVSPVDGLNDLETEHERVAFLVSEKGIAAKKILAFFRLWCVVEIAAAVENKKPIIVKGGKLSKKTKKIYEYKDWQMEEVMENLKHMIDTEKSECAVQADYDREMLCVRQMEGGVKNLNKLVSGVINGACASIGYKVLEVDAAVCGEMQPFLNSCKKMYALSNENERGLARDVLRAAIRGGRWKIVFIFLKNILENEVDKGDTKRKLWLFRLIYDSGVIGRATKAGQTETIKLLSEVEGIDFKNCNEYDSDDDEDE